MVVRVESTSIMSNRAGAVARGPAITPTATGPATARSASRRRAGSSWLVNTLIRVPYGASDRVASPLGTSDTSEEGMGPGETSVTRICMGSG